MKSINQKVSIPLQTQSMGFQQVKLAIDALFDQSTILTTADGVLALIEGEPIQTEVKEQLFRKFQLSSNDLASVSNIGKVLPPMPKFDVRKLAAVAERLSDLCEENGAWRQQFDSLSPSLVDQKVSEIHSRLDAFQDYVIRVHGFRQAGELLIQLYSQWESDAKQSESLWPPSYSDRLRQSANTFSRYDEELRDRPKWKFWKKPISRDDQSRLEQQFRSDLRLARQRISQLEVEIVQAVKKRLVDSACPKSIAARLRKLQAQTVKLQTLHKELSGCLTPLQDSATEVHLLRSTLDPIDSGCRFHDRINGVFEARSCGTKNVARQIQNGLRVEGVPISPTELAAMETKQAVRLLTVFAKSYFDNAIDDVLLIDLGDSDLRLCLVRAFQKACSKADSYLVFPRLDGVQLLRDTYLHCSPELRPILESIRPSSLFFSNPASDSEFHLPQRHVLTLTTNVLGPGHARTEYAAGRYIRDKMLANGTFDSIYPFDQPLANPLLIQRLPSNERDCTQLFELAVEFKVILARQVTPEKTLYTLMPMDDTVRHHFQVTLIRRRQAGADHFVQLLDESWFKELVDSCIPTLKANWQSLLRKQMDRASAASIAQQMIKLGILELVPNSNNYRFGKSFESYMSPRPELFFSEQRERLGLSRERFLRSMLQGADLYCRVIEDVISAEAQDKLPYRRLTSFAQKLVEERRSFGGT